MTLESKLEELRHLDDGEGVNIIEEIARLQGKIERQLKSIYAKLTPWQKVQVARHPQRPHFLDYMSSITDDFVALSGDRAFAEDQAILGGIGSLDGRSCMFIGMEKGKTVNTRLKHNFGMARPEGYRKAVRLMRLAERFSLPVVTLIDTPGAYPGVGAEERGQAEAIARAVNTGLEIRTAFVAVVIGEGGSGGGDRACKRRSRVDAEQRCLFAHQPGGLRNHSVARCLARRPSCRSVAPDRARSDRLEDRRSRHRRALGGCASQARCHGFWLETRARRRAGGARRQREARACRAAA